MNLYEIDEQIKSCVTINDDEALDTTTGEIIDIEQLRGLVIDKNRKIENIALWIKNLTAEAEAIKAEKNKLAAREQAANKKAESLKMYLSEFLSGEKFQTPKVSITWRRSEVVEFDNSCLIDLPAEFIRFKEPELNKTAVKAALKEGRKVEGCRIEEKQNLLIK